MARYNKGEFLTIPNKSALRGLSPNLQVLFFWLCEHSNDSMQSFPSRQTLARECGMSVDSLDRAMRKLVELEMICKTTRRAGTQNYTNLYEVLIVAAESENRAGVAADSGQVAAKTTLPSRKNRTENSIHLTQSIELNSKSKDLLVNSDKPSLTQPKPKLEIFFYMLVEALGFSETTKFTAGREAKLRKRGKTYTGSEILKAATNLGSDAYMQGENDAGKRYGTIDYLIRTDENIDKYLQIADLKFSEGAF